MALFRALIYSVFLILKSPEQSIFYFRGGKGLWEIIQKCVSELQNFLLKKELMVDPDLRAGTWGKSWILH